MKRYKTSNRVYANQGGKPAINLDVVKWTPVNRVKDSLREMNLSEDNAQALIDVAEFFWADIDPRNGDLIDCYTYRNLYIKFASSNPKNVRLISFKVV